MKVAACQLPDVRNDSVRAISLMRACALEAERAGARLVCFPECFLQGYDVSAAHVADVAIDLGSSVFGRVVGDLASLEPVIVFGLIEKEGGSFYNSALALQRGEVIAHYRKTHLLEGERSVFEPGEGAATFDILGVKIGINICYDLTFSASVKRAADSGAQLLVCPCSNMMPRALAEEWKLRHNEIRAQRAREHGMWILSSDIVGESDDSVSYGPTALIDPQGVVVAQVALLETGMVVGELHS